MKDKSKIKYTTGYTGNEEEWKGYVKFRVWGIPVKLDEITLKNMLHDARSSGPQIGNNLQSIMRNEG